MTYQEWKQYRKAHKLKNIEVLDVPSEHIDIYVHSINDTPTRLERLKDEPIVYVNEVQLEPEVSDPRFADFIKALNELS